MEFNCITGQVKNTNIPDYMKKEVEKMTVKITLLNLFQSICQALLVYPCVVLIIFQFHEVIPVCLYGHLLKFCVVCSVLR